MIRRLSPAARRKLLRAARTMVLLAGLAWVAGPVALGMGVILTLDYVGK